MVKSAAKEWNNLQNLSKEENHAHLMVALGAYWHGNQFFILQEEADCSLHDYLKGEGAEYESSELWRQMRGVADGLATLHRIYKGTRIAYHQDLKPANILIVRRVFKIADFGLLEFKPVPLPGDTSSTGVPNAHNAGYYAAPPQDRYTRDSDIWSLACIMSELSTCDIQGRVEFEEYRKARRAGVDTWRFFTRDGQSVKDAVLERHALLYNCVQSESPNRRDAATMRFQKEFYTKDFFFLLNNMFRSTGGLTDLSNTSMEVTVPDAGVVATTIESLHKAAVPAPSFDDPIRDLSMEQHLPDSDALNSSLMACVAGFLEILNRSNQARLPNTTLADLKQFVVNLQAKQHAERRQQGLKRLKPFLDRVEEFASLIVNLVNSTELMNLVWVGALTSAYATHPNKSFLRALSGFCSKYDRPQLIFDHSNMFAGNRLQFRGT